MKSILTIAFLAMSATMALAQQGVSNARDANGNLIRDNGLNSPRRAPAANCTGQVNRAPLSSAPKTNSTPGAIQGSSK